MLDERQLADFRRDGYVLSRGLFDREEMAALLDFARRDSGMEGGVRVRRDSAGNETKLLVWNDPPPEPYGLFSRSPRLVGPAEQLLGGEVYHYHSKMMLKEPRVGGAWEWHQDYGYWYDFGCLYPLLVSCLIAVDPATRENGCVQVLRGSQAMGRVNHGATGEQVGADMERVEAALARHDLVYIEAEPGDVLIFDCNLLHRSDANRSENPRWSLICCYNARRNDPYKESRHPQYRPFEKTADTAIEDWIASRR